MAKQILVVDDNKEAANGTLFVIENLSEDGEFATEVVYGGRECLDRLTKLPKVNLILLDMDMPGVSGADVIRALLEMKEPPVRVLVISAWGETWAAHWGLTELAKTPAYQKLVWPEAYDKMGEPTDLIDLIRHLLSEDGMSPPQTT